MNEHPDFIATELLSELKAENVRKDGIIKRQQKSFIALAATAFVVILVIIGGFLAYLNQYDFSSTVTQSAEGTYAIVDSDGNIIAEDVE
jgi:hypothetical protein